MIFDRVPPRLWFASPRHAAANETASTLEQLASDAGVPFSRLPAHSLAELVLYLEAPPPAELSRTTLCVDWTEATLLPLVAGTAVGHGGWAVEPGPGIAYQVTLRFPQVRVVFVHDCGRQSHSCAKPGSCVCESCAFARHLAHLTPGLDMELQLRAARAAVAWCCIDRSELSAWSGPSAIARGAVPLFDPSGWRTLVRNALFYLALDNRDQPLVSENARTLLGSRVRTLAVSIDEEIDSSALVCLAAYRAGQRAVPVSTFREFSGGDWRQAGFWDGTNGGTIVRDLDLRFGDYPTSGSLRAELREVSSKPWEEVRTQLATARTLEWRVFSQAAADAPANCRKPASSLARLRKLVTGATTTLVERLEPVRSTVGGHGAPFLNGSIARALHYDATRCVESGSCWASIVATVLLDDAYCTLLGASAATAAEIVIDLHRHEAHVETVSMVVSRPVDLAPRIHEATPVLYKLASHQGRELLMRLLRALRRDAREHEDFELAEDTLSWEWAARTAWAVRNSSFLYGSAARCYRRLMRPSGAVAIVALGVLTISFAIAWSLTTMGVWREDWSTAGVTNLALTAINVAMAVMRAESLREQAYGEEFARLPALPLFDFSTGLLSLLGVGLLIAILYRHLTRG